MSETWLPVPGYEGRYEVSDLGRVRSLLGPGRIMRPVYNRQGYATVLLCLDGTQKRHSIHRLVCHAFHGAPFEGAQCAHWDGQYANNRADNLRWATRSENTLDSIRHGTFKGIPPRGAACHSRPRGEGHPHAKLTAEQVREIRASNLGHKPLARLYGVSDRQIRRIRSGEDWPAGHASHGASKLSPPYGDHQAQGGRR
jgi:hypothetical protein